MEFAFTDEQTMIRDTAAAFLDELSHSDAVRTAMETELGYDASLWRRICHEMVWPAMLVPERYSGLGLGCVELAAVMEQMGRRLLCAPFFSTACLGINAILSVGSESQKLALLPRLCSGELTASLAADGIAEAWERAEPSLTAVREHDGYRLDGSLPYVLDGHSADLLIVAAQFDAGGTGLFALDSNVAGLRRQWQPTLDQTRRLARLELKCVRVGDSALLGGKQDAGPMLDRILQLATIALAAEQLGGAQQVLDMSVEYTKERIQFGRPVAGFQAIKHKAADMMLRCELARSAVYYAACVADEAVQGGPLGEELAEAASIAKASCSEAYFANAAEAIQMHGGVGFTWEYDVHLHFKRAKAAAQMLGTPAAHRERLARLLLD